MVLKFVKDLKRGKVVIKDERVATSTEHVANEIDRIAYGYGYVDLGKESIIYGIKVKKKIVVWTEILEADQEILEKALAYLIEIYFSINEKKFYSNYKEIRPLIMKNSRFEYNMITDFSDGNLPAIGGFKKSILDKCYYYLDFASADYISSYVTGKRYLFPKRVKFLQTLLKVNNKSIHEMVKAKRNNDLSFIEEIIPSEYHSKIALFSLLLENTSNSTRYLHTKYKFEAEMYRYISYLFYMDKLQQFNEDEREDIIENLLAQSNTLYNPDLKLNCGII